MYTSTFDVVVTINVVCLTIQEKRNSALLSTVENTRFISERLPSKERIWQIAAD